MWTALTFLILALVLCFVVSRIQVTRFSGSGVFPTFGFEGSMRPSNHTFVLERRFAG